MKGLRKSRILGLVFLLAFSLLTPAYAEEEATENQPTEEETSEPENREAVEINFSDTENIDWANSSIGKMKVKGIFQGYDDGTFKPNNPVTRLQAIITAVRLLGLEEEAENVSPEKKLYFKDAKYFENNSRAKGYVVVALENGLFDPSEDKVLPNQPATRVWISSLLVRALGLEEEALKAMSDIPDFTDAKKIPAAAIGYVNIATEYGIFSGNTKGEFSPNSNITRAQMAAVLDRTYGELLEENGADVINGTVTELSFAADETSGTITVNTFNGETLSYNISKDILVQFYNRFMSPDQIVIGDNIELFIENAAVVEATIYEGTDQSETAVGIQEVKLEAEFENEGSFELKYKNEKGKPKGEFKIKTEEEKEKFKGEEALEKIEEYLSLWNLSPEMGEEEIIDAILSSFGNKDEVKELEIKISFSNGSKIEIELENEDEDVDKDEDEDEEDHEKDEEDGEGKK